MSLPWTRLPSFLATYSTAVIVPLEAMVEKEPITVVLSEKGWIRALKGHVEPETEVKFKDGDSLKFLIHGQTTDKFLIFATNGRFYTVAGDKLPGGRGHGEPIRLMVDIPNGHDPISLAVFETGKKYIVASDKGRGFIVPSDDLMAQTKNGKQVLNVGAGEEAAAICDVMDGAFVPNISFGFPIISSLRKRFPDAFLDCHLVRPLLLLFLNSMILLFDLSLWPFCAFRCLLLSRRPGSRPFALPLPLSLSPPPTQWTMASINVTFCS